MRSTSYRFHILAALVVGALVSHTTQAAGVPDFTPFVDGTPAKAADVNDRFTAIKDAVNTNNTRLGTVETQAAGIPAINTKNTAQDTSIGTLNTTTADHETRLQAVEGSTDGNALEIGALKAKDTAHDGSINTLNTTMATHGADISNLKSENSSQAASITAITAKNSSQDSSISTNSSTNTTQDGSIAALTARLDAIESQVLATLTYPQIMTVDYRIAIAAGSGVVSYFGGDKVIMAGKVITLPAFSFNTIANKIYHLRFEAGAWKLFDTTSTAYNPGGAAEIDAVFDSRSESMLVARVTTDGSNSPTVDSLANKDRLQYAVDSFAGCTSFPPKDGVERPFATSDRLTGIVKSAQRTFQYRTDNYFIMLEKVVLMWARTPVSHSYSNNEGVAGASVGNFNYSAHVRESTRYRMEGEGDWVLPSMPSCPDISVVMSGQN